jgi:hypothetical protein
MAITVSGSSAIARATVGVAVLTKCFYTAWAQGRQTEFRHPLVPARRCLLDSLSNRAWRLIGSRQFAITIIAAYARHYWARGLKRYIFA